MTKKKFAVQAVAFCLAWCALPFLLACGAGCEEYHGHCACDQKPEQVKASEETKPSSEKPRKQQQPEWATGAVTAAMPASEASKDAKLDAERTSADNEGKRAAGLN